MSYPTLSCIGQPDIALKCEQLAGICFLYEQKDVFLWLPTKFGKSLCYEMLPFIFGFKSGGKLRSVVLVISPLVSLWWNKFEVSGNSGVCAAILSGNQEIDKCLLASEKDFEDQSSYTSGVRGTLTSLYVEPAEAIFGKFTEFVQLALDGFCFPARVCGML